MRVEIILSPSPSFAEKNAYTWNRLKTQGRVKCKKRGSNRLQGAVHSRLSSADKFPKGI
jgi:hypothetical protein